MDPSTALIADPNSQSYHHDNGSSLSNDSVLSREVVEEMIRRSSIFGISSSNFNPITQASLIAAFSILIAFGTAGNSLVCYVVLAKRHMRTPRNLLIANLATSDLVLCLFTQPFNLMKVSMPTWNLGIAICKLIPMAAGTNVFVSTISITAIALDRFHLIVHPTETDILLMKSGLSIALALIWILSMLMSTPMLVFSTTRSVEPIAGLKLYEVCVENPDHHYAKAAYSVASMIVQYLVPIAILSIAHAQICKKLRYRMTSNRPVVAAAPSKVTLTPTMTLSRAPQNALSPFQARRQRAEETRKKKTNLLLVMIAVVFAFSWMPLNVVNVIADFEQTLILSFDKNGLVFAICHLLVLSSACANPVLYGWLNDNFRQEFMQALCSRCGPEVRCCPGSCIRRDGTPSQEEFSKDNNHHELEKLTVKVTTPSSAAVKVNALFTDTVVCTDDLEVKVKVEQCAVSSNIAAKTYGSTDL